MERRFVAALVALILTACGPGQMLGPTITPSATSTSTPTTTPSPTATSTPTITPTATATPFPFLDAIYIPAGWTVVKTNRDLGSSVSTAVKKDLEDSLFVSFQNASETGVIVVTAGLYKDSTAAKAAYDDYLTAFTPEMDIARGETDGENETTLAIQSLRIGTGGVDLVFRAAWHCRIAYLYTISSQRSAPMTTNQAASILGKTDENLKDLGCK